MEQRTSVDITQINEKIEKERYGEKIICRD